MRLDPNTRDFAPFTDELHEVLDDRTTRLYLDTSLLMWLIRIGRDARRDFLEWCKARPAGTVRVPVWAAHELHRHLVRGTISNNVQAILSETEKKIAEFAGLANERADDVLCQARGFANRSSFVSAMEQTIARIKNLSNVVKIEDQLTQASDEVVAFANDYVLDSDLAPIIASLNASGEFRFSHLMPPGYLDRKDENKFGDVVIWEEIISDLPKQQDRPITERPSAILLSRDDKTDWVSSAPAIRSGTSDKPLKSNRTIGFDVTRPHPLLVHEFAIRSGGGKLYVVHPGVFASVLDYGSRKHGRGAVLSNLLAAAYRPEFLDRLAMGQLASADHAQIRGRRRPPIEPTVFVPPSPRDVMAINASDRIREYIEATPPDQDALAQRWIEQLQSGEIPPIQFGRLAAELAMLDRPEWRSAIASTLESLSHQLGDIRLNLLVSGMLIPAFFDRYADPLRQPQTILAELALILEAEMSLRPAFSGIARALAEKEVALPYVPGSTRQAVLYVVDLAQGNSERLIRDIRVGGQSVLQDPLGPDEPRLLSTMLGKTPIDRPSGADLRSLIARTYLIPFDKLDAKFDRQTITWAPSAGLVMLDTSSPGGLSALADDGGEVE